MVVTSIVFMGEVLRVARLLNVLLGLLIAGGPLLLGGAGVAAQGLGLAAGLALAALALPRGRITEQYGAGCVRTTSGPASDPASR